MQYEFDNKGQQLDFEKFTDSMFNMNMFNSDQELCCVIVDEIYLCLKDINDQDMVTCCVSTLADAANIGWTGSNCLTILQDVMPFIFKGYKTKGQIVVPQFDEMINHFIRKNYDHLEKLVNENV